MYAKILSTKIKQGKKVCKATAAQCAYICFLLASRSDRAKRLKQKKNKKSYSAQLLTAAGRCKNHEVLFKGRSISRCNFDYNNLLLQLPRILTLPKSFVPMTSILKILYRLVHYMHISLIYFSLPLMAKKWSKTHRFIFFLHITYTHFILLLANRID